MASLAIPSLFDGTKKREVVPKVPYSPVLTPAKPRVKHEKKEKPAKKKKKSREPRDSEDLSKTKALDALESDGEESEGDREFVSTSDADDDDSADEYVPPPPRSAADDENEQEPQLPSDLPLSPQFVVDPSLLPPLPPIPLPEPTVRIDTMSHEECIQLMEQLQNRLMEQKGNTRLSELFSSA